MRPPLPLGATFSSRLMDPLAGLLGSTVNDFNFGTLIRTDAGGDYTESNTLFTTRIQFYAIEIARNRLGLNERAHEESKKEQQERKGRIAAV